MATTEHSDLEQQIIKTAQQLFIEKGFVAMKAQGAIGGAYIKDLPYSCCNGRNQPAHFTLLFQNQR